MILKNQMGIQALKSFQDFMEDAANLEETLLVWKWGGNGSEPWDTFCEEQMGWSAAPSTQSIWNLLCFLFDTLKDVDWRLLLHRNSGLFLQVFVLNPHGET